ncbi:MAG TPA: hypothetical protein VG103_05680 [Chthoniobacterales bacterium]|nr:hypothetical protein [Chthoniobacterales bacterium]
MKFLILGCPVMGDALNSFVSRLSRRYPRGATVHVARPTRSIALVLKSVLPCNWAMRNIKSALGLAAAISLALAVVTLAADAKFRADGSIQRMSSDTVLLRTSAADIEIKRDAKTKVTGELRRGGAATVFYTKVAGENVATEIIMGGATKPNKTM